MRDIRYIIDKRNMLYREIVILFYSYTLSVYK